MATGTVIVKGYPSTGIENIKDATNVYKMWLPEQERFGRIVAFTGNAKQNTAQPNMKAQPVNASSPARSTRTRLRPSTPSATDALDWDSDATDDDSDTHINEADEDSDGDGGEAENEGTEDEENEIEDDVEAGEDKDDEMKDDSEVVEEEKPSRRWDEGLPACTSRSIYDFQDQSYQ
ncbi:hypothetical protein MMC21_002141 [Puttea exsequens]|nr:hypothetical protein [Puttea exsequens]